jgi:hypothetical protein
MCTDNLPNLAIYEYYCKRHCNTINLVVRLMYNFENILLRAFEELGKILDVFEYHSRYVS